jgi:hypothetical protein
MNIRQCRGNSELANPSFSYIVPVSQALFLATGMFVPASDRCGLGPAKESPDSCLPDRPSSPLLV